MVEAKYMVLADMKIHTLKKMCMIGTEEHNNELMTMNAVSMICDKDQII